MTETMTEMRYHSGGFIPEAPARNCAEKWDPSAGTYTRWDKAGSVVESRPLTADEVSAFARVAQGSVKAENQRTLEDRLRRLLALNTEFLALAAPTAAQQNTQVERLTRECSALIRLALRDLGDVSDT